MLFRSNFTIPAQWHIVLFNPCLRNHHDLNRFCSVTGVWSMTRFYIFKLNASKGKSVRFGWWCFVTCTFIGKWLLMLQIIQKCQQKASLSLVRNTKYRTETSQMTALSFKLLWSKRQLTHSTMKAMLGGLFCHFVTSQFCRLIRHDIVFPFGSGSQTCLNFVAYLSELSSLYSVYKSHYQLSSIGYLI